MKLYIDFFRLLEEEEIYFGDSIITGQMQDGEGEGVTYEIGFDKEGDDLLIVFEDAKFTVQIRRKELLRVAREFVKEKTMWHKRRKE